MSSKKELFAWINGLYGTNFKRFSQLRSGVMFLELFNILYPDVVGFEDIKYASNDEKDFVANFDTLQKAFDQVKWDKKIPIDELVKGDEATMESFIVWYKSYFDYDQSSVEYREYLQKHHTAKGYVPKTPRRPGTGDGPCNGGGGGGCCDESIKLMNDSETESGLEQSESNTEEFEPISHEECTQLLQQQTELNREIWEQLQNTKNMVTKMAEYKKELKARLATYDEARLKLTKLCEVELMKANGRCTLTQRLLSALAACGEDVQVKKTFIPDSPKCAKADDCFKSKSLKSEVSTSDVECILVKYCECSKGLSK